MKRECTKCKEKKELNEKNFYKTIRNTFGFHMQCKVCMIIKQKAHNAKENSRYNWTKLFIG